jgi:tetratricopeptide (TPR) repeat protein
MGAALLAAPCFAQSIEPQKISFDYVRLPLVPLPAGTRTFQPEVVTRYEEAIKQQKAARVAAVADAQSVAADAKKEYKAQSLGAKAFNKIVLDEGKPQEAVLPPADYTPQIFDTKSLATTYVTVSGLQRAQGAEADLRVEVGLNGFTQGDIVPLAVNGTTVKVAGVSTGDGVKHAYQISYKSPLTVKVTGKDGTVLLEEQLEATNTYQQAKTEAFATENGLAKYWQANQMTFMRKLDEDLMKDNMKLVAEMLDSRFGQRTITRNTSVVVVMDKKINYDEFPQAYEKALMGYKMLAQPARAAEAVKQMEEAVALWNKALAESNPKDKKARIDAKVTAAALLNAAEANMWLNNFDESERLLAKLKLLDISRYNDAAKELSTVLQDQRARYQANHKS